MATNKNDRKLCFYLLGPPSVNFEDQNIHIPRRQVRTLLYLLASQTEPISYQTLHYLFWANQPEKICRRNLSHLFTHIRNVLPNKNMLIHTSTSARLDPDLTYSDVIEFIKLCNQPAKSENPSDYIQADKLYRGPYLEGKFFPQSKELDKFIDDKRMNLELMYQKNLSNLVTLYKNLKNYSKAIEYAETYLRLDNLNEDIICELLILHSLKGNNSKIFQTYDKFSSQLKEELGINPSPNTRKLFQQISASFSASNDEPSSEPRINDEFALLPTKYQRTRIQALERILSNRNGIGGVALIAGEIGMGKSDLITSYLLERTPDQEIFRITCTPSAQKIRFFPFRELSRKMNPSENQGSLNLHLFSTHLNEVASQLSKPVQIQSSITDNLIEIIYERDFSLIRDLFEELVKIPVLITIIVENIEWCDEDSLETFLFLSEKHKTQQIRFIFSFCCKKEDKLKIFEQQVELSASHLGTLHLENLPKEDIKGMLEDLFGKFDQSDWVADQLFLLTGGNPYFISEILQWMKTNRFMANYFASMQTFNIPRTITQRIIARFERLSTNEKNILQLAAVRESPFTLNEIPGILELSPSETLEAVNDLICRNLIGHEDEDYFIKYKIVHQSILSHMNAAQKQIYKNLQKKTIAE